MVWAPRPFNVDPLSYLYAAAGNAASAGNYASSLSTLAASLTAPVITPVFPTLDGAPAISVPEPPAQISFTWDVPGLPDAFNRTLNIDGYLPATFDEDPPVLVYGSAPTKDFGPVPAAPPINTDFEFPTDPSISFPPPPALLSISTYKFDGVTIPEFVGDVSELQIADPMIYTYTPGSGYTSALLTKIVDALDERINGGTGLPPEVELSLIHI